MFMKTPSTALNGTFRNEFNVVTASMFEQEARNSPIDGEGEGYVQGLTVDGYELEIKGNIL